MASKELIEKVEIVEQLIKANGEQEEYADALRQYAEYILEVDKDREYGLYTTNLAKKCYEKILADRTDGGTMWDLEKYCFENNVDYKILDDWYKVVLLEAQHMVLDSYLMYLERKREPKQRFYMPKRKQFLKIGLIQALQDMLDDKLDVLSISLPPGTGKEIADNVPVLTTKGWKNHGDLVVGDILFNSKGETVKVTHIHPKCKSTHIVKFADGEEIECHENHEWILYDRHKLKTVTIETKEILKSYLDKDKKNGFRCRYFLNQKSPLIGEYKELPIEPYSLGAWLGDGTNKAPNITIDKKDKAIAEKINTTYPISNLYIHKEYGTYRYSFKGLMQSLRKENMCMNERCIKHIPETYLTASIEQRLQLLAGLLDTDGTLVKENHRYHFTTTEQQLKEDFVSLVSTFGWRCCVSEEEPKVSSSGICGRKKVYTIGFNPTMHIPCVLKRKQLFEFSKPRKIGIVEIRESEERNIGNCITVKGGEYLVGKRLKPTHNSTMEKFFHSGVCGWFPEDYSLFISHSAGITRMYYDGVYEILSTDDYTWKEIFPECKITSTNAKLEQININEYKPFPNVQTASVGSELAGKVRASKYLFVDDLIGKIEEALNKNILDKLWNFYSTDALQRKTVDKDDKPCKEIHIATRWSVHDVIGRLKNELENDKRAKFIAVPDINPKTNESNFDYEFKGFTKEFFQKQERFMDDISYRCLYKNDPIEREGLLYTDDSIRCYLELPDREPDAVLGVCDTKTTGIDFMVLTVFAQYDNDYYLIDCVCDDNTDFGEQQRKLAQVILDNNMQQCEFESNAGGSRLAQDVSEIVKASGGRCNITTKPTETNKETRIIVNSDWVKKNCLFKDASLYAKKTDYGRFMDFMMSYSVVGKNKHDDVVDALANFTLFVSSKYNYRQATIMRSPIW